MDSDNRNLRACQPDPPTRECDLPLRFRQHFGERDEFETNAHCFFVGGVLSFPLSLPFFLPDATFVGASAAIFTLAAVVMLLKPLRFSWLLLLPVGMVAIVYFLYNALAVYFNLQSHVAYISHVIGFSLGIPFGIAWSPNWKKNLAISVVLLIIYFVALYVITQCVLPRL